ncbi:copper transporter 6-like [Magnolia sinica]|uniref:copper transporter 6-like n=1 Tax=Magnolia sinica TaxID=86752 RepID=UPI00265B4986|nr:copper transporter 6-like [Magnolia sinica]
MDHDHGMHGDGGMMGGGGMPSKGPGMHRHHMMMHMTFFWGKNAEILFSGWPGTKLGMYILALIVVFVFSVLVEWLSHCRLIKPGRAHVVAGIMQTVLHAARVGLAYLVMLAVMSFNGGVLIAAIAGHSLGFLLFGSRLFHRSTVAEAPPSDLPPMKC